VPQDNENIALLQGVQDLYEQIGYLDGVANAMDPGGLHGQTQITGLHTNLIVCKIKLIMMMSSQILEKSMKLMPTHRLGQFFYI
jgi:hypothetical protein